MKRKRPSIVPPTTIIPSKRTKREQGVHSGCDASSKECLINKLPDELLVEIFSRIDTFTLQMNVTRTCRWWNSLAQDDMVYRERLRYLKPWPDTPLIVLYRAIKSLYQRTLQLLYVARDGAYVELCTTVKCPFCVVETLKLKHYARHLDIALCNTCDVKITLDRSSLKQCKTVLYERQKSEMCGYRCKRAVLDPSMDRCFQCYTNSWCWGCDRYTDECVVTRFDICVDCLKHKFSVCCVCHQLMDKSLIRRCENCPYVVLCGFCLCPCEE